MCHCHIPSVSLIIFVIVLVQVSDPPKIHSSEWKCQATDCNLTDNLWLNLSDGSIFCGRRQFISTDVVTSGNEHAKQHYFKFVKSQITNTYSILYMKQ